jgi:hypothetical protein
MSQEEKRVERCSSHLEQLDESVLAEARLREALPDLPHDLLRRVRHCGRRGGAWIPESETLECYAVGERAGTEGEAEAEAEAMNWRRKQCVRARSRLGGDLGSWRMGTAISAGGGAPSGACDTYKGKIHSNVWLSNMSLIRS